jgi:predicted dienelactone hydrolase
MGFEVVAAVVAAGVGLLALLGAAGAGREPGAARRRRVVLSVLALAPAVVAVLAVGVRVPTAPVLVVAAVAAVLVWRVRRRRVVAAVLVGVLGLLTAVPAVLLPPLRLPSTADAVAIGSYRAEWTDTDRQDPYADDGSARRVVVEIWYPADAASAAQVPAASYPQEVATALGAVLGTGAWPFAYVSGAATAVHPGADVADAGAPYPVVLYSPGNGSTRFQNTDLVQRLVSDGWVVVGVDHPSTAASLTFADGSTTTATADPPVAAGPDATEDHIIDVRAEDLSFVLDQVEELAGSDGVLGGALDLSTVAAVGHSYGGATAGEAAARDDRIDAVVAMDGTMWGTQIFTTGLDVPLLYLQATGTVAAFTGDDVSAADAAYAEQAKRGLNQVFATAGDSTVYALVDDANHYTFTDLALLGPVFSAGRSGADAAGLTADLVTGFLDAALRGTGGGVEAAAAAHRGIDVRSDPDVVFPEVGSTR